MKTDLLVRAVNILQATNAFGKRAMAQLTKQAEVQARATPLATALLEKLANAKMIGAAEKDAAAAQLASHDTTLQLLSNAVDHIIAQNAQLKVATHLGAAEKTAGSNAGDPTSPAFRPVGARSVTKTAADRAFEDRLLGN